MGSVATCERLEESLQQNEDPLFSRIKTWEMPLALLYRLKYWHFGGPTKISDLVSGDTNVYTVFLIASAHTNGKCDDKILMLQQRYLDGSRNLDDYDSTGYTALHQAIILNKPDFVQVLLAAGAGRSLVVQSDNKLTNNKNATELALWLSEQKYSTPDATRIAEMLVDISDSNIAE